jgi:hypothetical protein
MSAVLTLPKLCDGRQTKLSIPDPTEEAHQIAHQCVIWHTHVATDRFRNNELPIFSAINDDSIGTRLAVIHYKSSSFKVQ